MSVNLSRKLARSLLLLPAAILLLVYLLSITHQLVVYDIETAWMIFYGAFIGYFLIPLLAVVEIARAKWLAALFNIFVFFTLADRALALGIVSVGSFIAALLSPIVTIILTSFGLPLAYLYWRQTRYIIVREEHPKDLRASVGNFVGQAEILDKAKQIARLLQVKNRRRYEQYGDRLNGLLVVGNSGSGKTQLIRVIAAEANAPLFYIDISSLRSVFWMIARGELSRVYKDARAAAERTGAAIVCLGNLDLLDLDSRVSGNEDQGAVGLDSLLADSDAGLVNCIKTEMSAYNVERSLGMHIQRLIGKIFRLQVTPPYVLTVGEITQLEAFPPSLRGVEYFADVIVIPPLTAGGIKEVIQLYLLSVPHDETIDVSLLARIAPETTPEGVKVWLNSVLRNAVVEGRTSLTLHDFNEVDENDQLPDVSHLEMNSKTLPKTTP